MYSMIEKNVYKEKKADTDRSSTKDYRNQHGKDDLMQYHNIYGSNTETIQRFIKIKNGKQYEKTGDAFKDLNASLAYPKKQLFGILSHLNKENFECENMGELNEKIRTLYQTYSDYNVQAVNKEDWGILHRLSSHSFSRFIKANHGGKGEMEEEAVLKFKKEYEETNAKYAPPETGHNWEANDNWLENVIEKFSKFLLTDLPLSFYNLIRKTKTSNGGARVSAYAKEIAFFLMNDCLPISKRKISGGSTSLDVIALIHKDNIPEPIKKIVSASTYVDKNIAKNIYEAKNYSTKKMKDFFSKAGIPVQNRDENDVSYLEKQDKNDASDLEKQDTVMEEMPNQILNEVKLNEVIRAIVRIPIKWNADGQLEGIITVASDNKYIANMSKNGLKKHIKLHKKELWPGTFG